MKSTTKARRLPADLQTAVDTQFQRSDNKARRPYEHNLLTSAAKNTPSMAWTAGNAPSMAWTAILTASLVNRAQLAASLAALFRQYQLGAVPAASFWQHQLGNTKAIKELQVSRTKNHTPTWRMVLCFTRYSRSTGQSPYKKAKDIRLWP